MIRFTNKHLVFWLPAVLVIIADQLIKAVIASSLSLGQSIKLLPFLSITRIHNKGIAFGLLRELQARWILVSIALLVCIILALQYSKMKDLREILLIGLIVGGALGNVIDRVFLGYVIDYVSISIWPAFNIADSAISISVVLLIFFSLKK